MGKPENPQPRNEEKQQPKYQPLSLLDKIRCLHTAFPSVNEYFGFSTIPIVEKVQERYDDGFRQLTVDLIDELDGSHMKTQIINNCGWSDAEADEFFSDHKKPFKSKLELADEPPERTIQLILFGRVLFSEYIEQERKYGDEDEMTLATESILTTFLSYAVQDLYGQEYFDLVDKINGIDPADRRAGNIKPTPEICTVFLQASREAAEEDNETYWQAVYSDVLAATQDGNLQFAHSFLQNNKGNPTVRKALALAIEKRKADEQLKIEKLRLVWKAEQFRLAIGIDWETYLKINLQPDSQTIERSIFAILDDPDSVRSTLHHLEKEAPQSYQEISNGGVASYYDILSERAAFHGFSNNLETQEELDEKKVRVLGDVAPIFPLAFVETAPDEETMVHIHAPTGKGASPRPFHMNYPNHERETIYFGLSNPWFNEGSLRAYQGHELTHVVQAKVLQQIGKKPDDVNSIFKESHALVIEKQIRIIDIQKQQKQQTSSSTMYPDLAYALKQRKDGPWVLTQQAVRIAMEELSNQGKQVLTDDDARAIIADVEAKIADWEKRGVPITNFAYGLNFPMFLNLDPLDGFAYIVPVVEEPKESSSSPSNVRDLNTEFKLLYGVNWPYSYEARLIFWDLFIHGTNPPPRLRYSIKDARPEEIKIRLGNLGVDVTKL